MAAIVIRNPLGMVPLLNPQLLPEGAAVEAQNVNLSHGDIRPVGAPVTVATPTKAGTKKTIYRFGESVADDTEYWWTWTTDVDVVRAPIDGDTSERTYFTGDGYPKKTDNATALAGGTAYPMNAYRLGVPQPDTVASTYTVSGVPTSATSPSINAAYILTYVTAWGEEGRPSSPIGVATWKPGQAVTLDNLPGAPGGNYNISAIRIYRSNTGSSGTNYQFLVELPVGSSSYMDTTPTTGLGEVCVTFGWEEPPSNGFGMTLGANGIAIMLAGRTIYPCVPFVLYAYPPEYQLSTETDLVGAGAFGQSFAILTKSNPYVLSGIDPASMSMIKLDTNQACVSKRSIVEMMGGVIYASPDGLWMVSDNGLKPLTQSLMTRDQWQAYKPESIHAYELDGRYHAFYDNGTTQGHLIFDFGRVPYMLESDQYCTAAYNDPLRDAMYMAIGSTIKKWNAGDSMYYVWRSKDYRSPWYVNPGYGKVEAAAYPVTFKLYANDALVYTKVVQNSQPFRLPPVQSRVTAVQVEGTNTVRLIAVAETGEEIARA